MTPACLVLAIAMCERINIICLSFCSLHAAECLYYDYKLVHGPWSQCSQQSSPAVCSQIHWLCCQRLVMCRNTHVIHHAVLWASSSVTLRNVAGKADSSRKPWHEAWRVSGAW